MSKLDRLVAERVTGVKPHLTLEVSNDGGESSAFGSDDFTTTLEVHAWLKEKQAGGIMLDYKVVEWKHYPRYSTDIEAAWEVVEHLRKQRSAYDAPTDPTWRVSLTGSGNRWICDVADWRERLDVAACDKEPCMAICWAALRAFKVDEATIQEAMR